MKNRKKRKRSGGKHGVLNGVVICLLVLAVLLGGIAAWRRARRNSAPGGAVAEPYDSLQAQTADFWANRPFTEDLRPVSNFPSGRGLAPLGRFLCPRCRSTCWTDMERLCLSCPFCGSRMEPSLRGRLRMVGAFPGGAWGPTPIAPDAVPPHGNRGACTNCHTVTPASRSSWGLTPAGAPPGSPAGPTAPEPRPHRTPGTLIREFGIEVGPSGGSGVLVTGVMGNSYAAKAGLRAGDIVLRCNGSTVRDAGGFQRTISRAAPEADAQVTILRNGRTRDLSIMVGEGEMEGFQPLRRP